MATCEKCGAEIIFAVTRHGHRIPIDPAPVEDGNMELVEEETADGRVLKALRRLQGSLLATPVYKTHFATCPEADYFRGRSRGSQA